MSDFGQIQNRKPSSGKRARGHEIAKRQIFDPRKHVDLFTKWKKDYWNWT